MSQTYRILWAEDEDLLREIMCELLQAEGFHCTPAVNGMEAKALLQNEAYDLLVADFNMPILNGPNLLLWCRQNNFHLPVIFVSANVERTPIEEMVLRDCCSSLLSKPFSAEDLLEAITKSGQKVHEFHCRGKTVSSDRGNMIEDFPGRHYLKD